MKSGIIEGNLLPFCLLSSAKLTKVFAIGKNEVEYIGTLGNFDTQNNLSCEHVFQLNYTKHKILIKTYKQLIINGTKTIFISKL